MGVANEKTWKQIFTTYFEDVKGNLWHFVEFHSGKTVSTVEKFSLKEQYFKNFAELFCKYKIIFS